MTEGWKVGKHANEDNLLSQDAQNLVFYGMDSEKMLNFLK